MRALRSLAVAAAAWSATLCWPLAFLFWLFWRAP